MEMVRECVETTRTVFCRRKYITTANTLHTLEGGKAGPLGLEIYIMYLLAE